jgi:hypothetical protein
MLLINHSSDPAYSKSANPVIRLHKSHDEFLEADFGPIKAHSFTEQGLDQLFPNWADWSKNSKNIWTVAQCKGVTLASFHTYRRNDNTLLAIEHSRPSHAQVINYWKKK